MGGRPDPKSKTRATEALARAGVEFTLLEYEVRDEDVARTSLGEAAAEALGIPAAASFKTLVADADGTLVCAVVPVTGTLSLKALARAAGAKRAAMADCRAAQRATGYVVGGISPFGQTKRLPIFVDATVQDHAWAYVSGGKRGLEVRVAPDDLLAVTGATPVAGLGNP